MKKIIILITILGSPLLGQGFLSDSEIDSLKYIKESETLVYNLYDTLYNMWEHETFNKLKISEEEHIKAVNKLIEEYKVEVEEETSPYFKRLYNDFTRNALKSFYDALYIAATAEEMAIYDLQEYIKNTTDKDLIETYTLLTYSSMANLRVLNRELMELGSKYEGKYLGFEELRRILGN